MDLSHLKLGSPKQDLYQFKSVLYLEYYNDFTLLFGGILASRLFMRPCGCGVDTSDPS